MKDATKIIDDILFNLKLERFEGEKPLQALSQKLNAHPKQILRIGVAAILVIVSLTLLFFADHLVFTALSVVYPAFATARVLSHDNLYSKDGKHWASYWVCFGVLGIAEMLLGFILHHILFFNLMRCIFVIWLSNKKTRGAEYLYHNFLHPQIKKFAPVLDEHVDQPRESATKQD